MVKIVRGKALLLDPNSVKTLPPSLERSRMTPNGLLVYWGHKEAEALTAHGVEVPSPILKDYSWPGKHAPFAHQKETAAFLSLRRRAFCFNEQGCVDADTEYLSPTGWVRIADYKGGKVAQYHPDTGVAEFVEPTEFVKLPCSDMVRVKTKYGLDQLLSPEHRVLLVDAKSKKPKREVVSAAELLRRHDGYHAGERARLGGAKGGTASIAFSSAAIPTTFTVTGGEGIPLTDAQLRVQVAVMADGHFSGSADRCVVRLKRQRKVERLRTLLQAASISYTETAPEYATAKGFHVFTFYAPLREKRYGPSWWRASAAQLSVIADEMLHWDGGVTNARRFSTTDKNTADFIQYAFCASGRTARVFLRVRRDKGHTEYTVRVRNVSRLCLRGSGVTVSTAVSTDGFKYCFMVPSTFLIFRRNGCVFASGNTGKTASVIWAADYLMRKRQVRRVLVLCPLSVMKPAWQQDLFTFAMHRSCDVAYGTAAQRRKVIRSSVEFVITNYEGLAVAYDDIAAGGFDLIVVDECTTFKNPQTRRWKLLSQLVNATNPRLWMLTGTPAAQSPVDAFGLAKLVNPERCPRFLTEFRNTVMHQVSRFTWVPKANASAYVHRLLQPAIRFEKADCLDLPEVIYMEREVPLTPQQAQHYKRLRDEMLLEAGGKEISAVNAAVRINKLLQISCGAVYSDDGEVVHFDVSSRLAAVMEVIREARNKVLVFAPFVHTLEVLEQKLTAEGVSYGVISGKVSANNRNELVRRFQSTPDPRVMLIQPQAASHGLTLTAADTVIWYAPVTSVETYLQANARINRPGQRNAMTVVHIQGSPVEAKLYRMLHSNIAAHQQLVDLYRAELEEKS